MKFEIISKELIQLIGLSVELTRSQQTNYHIIRNHWQKFNSERSKNKIALGINWQKFGVSIKKGEKYLYTTAVPFKSNINNFETLEIEAGDYARFQHIVNMDLIIDIFVPIIKM